MDLTANIDNFFVILLIGFAWFIGSFAFKHYRNRKKGLYFDDPSPGSVVYSETYVSGRSHKSTKTRFSGASNCLKLAITPTQLFIRPLFPVIVFGTHSDQIHVVEISKISKIEKATGFMARGLDLVFSNDEDIETRFTVISKNEMEFKAVLEEQRMKYTQRMKDRI